MVCDTVAAGLGVRGAVIFWLRVVRVERTSIGMTAYRVIVSDGIFVRLTVKKMLAPLS